MARKITPEHLASENWIVHTLTCGQYHGSVTLQDVYWYMPTEDEDADSVDAEPGAKGAEFCEYTEHEITLPVSSQTRLRPGMHVRITVEQVV